jgi:beta-N-acetylhexosaminidase
MTATTVCGPVMVDVAGLELTDAERVRLRHPLVGGVILFGRNYQSPEQILALTRAIRALRKPRLLIGVDHEGGRVQRFRTGFSRIPPMRALGRIWDEDPQRALAAAEAIGDLVAAELSASGVDFSFTPVLDLDYGVCAAIGDRALHADPDAVSRLAAALLAGLRRRGVQAVGKHFPGHGFVAEDSHVAFPVDARPLAEIEARDLVPYRRLIPDGLRAVMPAHVIYPAVDDRPAGFSRVWLQGVLRGRLGFQGLIFSDDLSMEAASVAGGITERAQVALEAGCDMVLACNRPEAADELVSRLQWQAPAQWAPRIEAMYAPGTPTGLRALQRDVAWVAASAELARCPTA